MYNINCSHEQNLSEGYPEAVKTAVMNITVKLHKTKNFHMAMTSAAAEIGKLCGTDKCAIYTVDKSTRHCSFINADGVRKDVLDLIASSMERTPYEVAETWEKDLGDRDCLILRNLEEVNAIDPVWCKSLQSEGLTNIILYPLRFHQNLAGFIWAASFDPDKIMQVKDILELTSFIIASVISNHQLFSRIELMTTVDAFAQFIDKEEYYRNHPEKSRRKEDKTVFDSMLVKDISQEVFNCNVFPGDPQPTGTRIMSIANGDVCNLTELKMCAHNGTHVDAPFHFINDGMTIDQTGLEPYVGKCYVARHTGNVTAENAEAIMEKAKAADSAERIIIAGKATVTAEAAKVFAGAEIKLLGNESQTVGPEDAPKEVHMILLSAEVALLEGIVLENVNEGSYFLSAAPLNLGGCDGAPCRAYLLKS